ncbi:MAG: serine/threonine protein kinase [Deltaproteobacteria bacterium]|nr:serine/threonine protein kinase [Deltaproteobacteria bacterium]MDQ3298762.1 serine/threonine protein kinase [Myxococcota bacterium]
MGATLSPSPDVGGVSIGSVLDGRYRIDGVLGTGGMGRVYRGEHTGIGRAVAIKVLHTDLSRNREAAQRFQREALASGRLDHPNIVGVSDFGVLDDGACYLVMEALDGESLGARLERERRIPWSDALDILRGVLHGLRHAHDRGVVHRDIKPDNIFLARKDGASVVKILDFGIAKLFAGSADDPASTRAGLTVGTPAYLSPEQAVGGEILPASDLYSATIVLFEMLAGRPPFAEKEPLAMLGAHVSRPPPRIADVAPDVVLPLGLEDVIQRGLEKVSAQRYHNALEYLAALDAIANAPVMAAGSAPVAVPITPAALGVLQTASFTPFPPSAGQFDHTPTPFPQLATPNPGAPPRPHLHTPNPEFGDQSIIMTVTPGSSMATPMPGVYTTPIPGAPIPGPGSFGPPDGAAPTAMIERQQRAVSLAEPTESIPRRWLVIGGVVLVVGLILALVLLASSSGGTEDAQKNPAKLQAPIVMPVPTVDRETALKALLHDLQTGKTCADRKLAVARLADLGDPRAIDALKRARYRMRGGMLGIGDDNTNGCLKADAEAAVKKLGGTLR